MTFKHFIKKLWKRHTSLESHAQVHEKIYEPEPVQTQHQAPVQDHPVEPDVDLSPQKDLENYARGLSISKKSLEQLISSGMLMPDELEVAEKIVRFMRDKDRGSDY